MTSSFKEQFARVVPTRGLDRVESGSRVVFAIRPGDKHRTIRTVSAAIALARCGISMAKAKRVVEEAVEKGRAVVELPKVESEAAVVAELSEHGMSARRLRAAVPIDVAALRAHLELTQEDFAIRFGFKPEAVKAWEQRKREPSPGTLNYLKIIQRMPDQASEALEDDFRDVNLSERGVLRL